MYTYILAFSHYQLLFTGQTLQNSNTSRNVRLTITWEYTDTWQNVCMYIYPYIIVACLIIFCKHASSLNLIIYLSDRVTAILISQQQDDLRCNTETEALTCKKHCSHRRQQQLVPMLRQLGLETAGWFSKQPPSHIDVCKAEGPRLTVTKLTVLRPPCLSFQWWDSMGLWISTSVQSQNYLLIGSFLLVPLNLSVLSQTSPNWILSLSNPATRNTSFSGYASDIYFIHMIR